MSVLVGVCVCVLCALHRQNIGLCSHTEISCEFRHVNVSHQLPYVFIRPHSKRSVCDFGALRRIRIDLLVAPEKKKQQTHLMPLLKIQDTHNI